MLCAEGGNRTLTPVKEYEFESYASANSATPAFAQNEPFGYSKKKYTNSLHTGQG